MRMDLVCILNESRRDVGPVCANRSMSPSSFATYTAGPTNILEVWLLMWPERELQTEMEAGKGLCNETKVGEGQTVVIRAQA